MRELLSSIDAEELAEWQIYLNLDYWKKHISEKEMTPEQRTAALKAELFKGVKVNT